MLALAVVIGYVLGWANKAFHVPVNERVERVLGVLPGANCGGCGFIGCGDYAEAVAAGKAEPNKCPVGGEACAKSVAAIMGIDLSHHLPYRPVVHCGAHTNDKLGRHPYSGEPTCSAANVVSGVQGCTYGCLAFGDCVRACRFDAIHVVDGLATVDYEKCTGCGACEKACPRHIISMLPFKADRMLVVKCSNKDFGKDVKAVCKVGCVGCKACSRVSMLFKMESNLPRVDYEAYSSKMPGELLAAIEKCPARRLEMVGKPSLEDVAQVADETLPEVAQPDFKTTADNTEWRG